MKTLIKISILVAGLFMLFVIEREVTAPRTVVVVESVLYGSEVVSIRGDVKPGDVVRVSGERGTLLSSEIVRGIGHVAVVKEVHGEHLRY